MQKQMLFVEDDDVIRENYTELLADEGFEVSSFADRHSAINHARNSLPDIALLDISLCGERDAGFQMCSDLRQLSPQLPILFLTSHDSEMDKISGMRLGADDYLTKDVSVDYLIIRIEAILRRFETLTANGKQLLCENKCSQSDLFIDDNIQAHYWRQQKVDLTLTQFHIIKALASQPGQVKSLGQLMRSADMYVEPNTITAHIKTIRHQFKVIDSEFDCIKTERGRGYRWLEE